MSRAALSAADVATRRQRILDAATRLADGRGWDAVTTRALAKEIGFTEPVLYWHFPQGKEEIIGNVAVNGFEDLARRMRQRRLRAREPRKALTSIAEYYLQFASEQPALYEAMFVRPLAITFARADTTPPELLAAFHELELAIAAVVPDDDHETLAELFWSGLHGLATLSAAGRLRPHMRAARIDALVAAVR